MGHLRLELSSWWPGLGAWWRGASWLLPIRHFPPSPRFRIYSNHSALESLAVSGEPRGRPGLGSGWAARASPPPLGPDCILPAAQLIPLQAPLKTMLQLGVMPLINGRGGVMRREGGQGDLGRPRLSQLSSPAERTRRGVQIPLPEGMDFVREVVTNHAVSGAATGKQGRAVPSLPPPPPPESYTDPPALCTGCALTLGHSSLTPPPTPTHPSGLS